MNGSFFPVAGASQSAAISGALIAVLSAMGSLALGWCLYAAWAVWNARTPQPSRAARTPILFTVTAALVLVELGLFFGMAQPMWLRRSTAPPITPRTIVVRVVAQQYQWAFHYPGPDGQFGEARPELVTPDNPAGLDRTSPHASDDIVAPVFHVPVNRPVVAQLTSKDTIHSFGVAELRVKQDVIPGIVATVWFTPKSIGRFDIVCSQLCGPKHDTMRGQVLVENADDYARFLATAAGREGK